MIRPCSLRGSLAAIVASASVVASAVGQVNARADEVVSHVREALGLRTFASHEAGIRLTGEGRLIGLDCEFELVCDAAGRFMERFSARGEPVRGFGITYGFDGTRAWTDDIGGERLIIECGDRESAILGAGIITGRWFADGAPMTFTLGAPGGVPEGAVRLDFKLDDGVASGTVDVDTATWLPRRWRFGEGADVQTVELTGIVGAGAMKFPARVEQSSAGGQNIVTTIAAAADAPAFLRSPYEPVLTAPNDVKFDASISPNLEVRRAPTGHLLVHPLVSGKDVGWFIFDTGAGSNCLDSRAAEELGVEKFGEIPAAGVGGHVSASLCRPDTLTLGPVTLEKSMLTILDLAFLDQYMGTKIGGIIGYGLLFRVVAEYDNPGARISLHDPATFDRAGLKWQKLTLYNRHPCVEASFEDHSALFKLDTGAQNTVTFHYPAVEQFNLLEGRETTDATQGGVGGRVAAKAGMLKWFELGGVRTDNLQALFAGENKGAFADKYTAGNIGGGLLKPFTLVTDYQHGRIAFVKRDNAAPAER